MSILPTPKSVVEAAERIAGRVVQTPVLRNAHLDEIAGANLFIKAECLQETGSFKLRGATNRLMQVPLERRSAGVVAYSSGNHAQGIARAARRLGMPAVIVMPRDAPAIKMAGVQADGADLVLYDRDRENRESMAAEIAQAKGAVVVPSYDDPMIITGQGTCGLEFGQQVQKLDTSLQHLVCCAGGGGLISGIALAFEALELSTEFWTAEPEGHEDWARSLAQKQIEKNAPGTRSICDAILTPEPGVLTWQIAGQRATGGCVVTDEHIKQAMRLAFRHLKVVVEPGGAAALAAALFALPEAAKDQNIGVVLTGANVDADQYARILAEDLQN